MIKALLLLALVVPAGAQTLEDVYAQAHGRVVPPIRRCWTRGYSAAADKAGMPQTVCVDRVLVVDGKAEFVGFAVLAGGAQREQLSNALHTIYGAKDSSFATAFVWNAGPGESDEESVFQLAFQRADDGSVKETTLKPLAFRQCPERGCSYACGVTSVEFAPAEDPTAPRPRTSY